MMELKYFTYIPWGKTLSLVPKPRSSVKVTLRSNSRSQFSKTQPLQGHSCFTNTSCLYYQAGFIAALPYLVMAAVVQGSGHLADYLRARMNVSTELVRKVFTCGGIVDFHNHLVLIDIFKVG